MQACTSRFGVFLACCGFALGLTNLTSAQAATYPERPIRFIVGFPPGGGTDAFARFIAQKLSEKWGQPVVVENRSGAGGTIAADMVAHSPADGYVIHLATGNHTITSLVGEYKLNFDPVKSFAAVTLLGQQPDVLLVNASLPVKSINDFIALAKSKPGQMNYGSTGPGGTPFLEFELFKKVTDTNIVEIPYKGGGELVPALLAGNIHAVLTNIAAALELVKSGRLKALAVCGNVRIPALPDVPTMAEAANLQGFDLTNWYGVLAPAGTPRDIVNSCAMRSPRWSPAPSFNNASPAWASLSLPTHRNSSPSSLPTTLESGRL